MFVYFPLKAKQQQQQKNITYEITLTYSNTLNKISTTKKQSE